MSLRTSNLTAWLLASATLLACTDPLLPPPVSLDGPTDMAVSSYCLLTGDAPRRRAPASACEGDNSDAGTILTYGFVSNHLSDSLALISFNRSLPELVDLDPGIPGITHIPVGDGPTEVVASNDGNFVFSLNSLSDDISVVSAELAQELARVKVDAAVFGLVSLPDSDTVAFVSEDGKLHTLTWTFSCDGEEGAYYEDCVPEFTYSLEQPLNLPRDMVPNSLSAAPQGRVMATLHNRPVLVEIGLDGGSDATCLDDREAPPCITRLLPLTYACMDTLDNDGDGFADSQDPQCLSPLGSEDPTTTGRGRATTCNDGIDNDRDGLVDALDPGCSASDDSETDAVTPVACNDGLDNDNDGLTDDVDPDCVNPATNAWIFWHTSEFSLPACADGEDNDNDGLIDFPEDPDCAEAEQNTENPPLGDGPCSDGIDNDRDGATDLFDTACANPNNGTEVAAPGPCNDGLDNDNDGLVDFPEDPDCYSAAGTTEGKREVNAYGPVAVDPDGAFAYVVDRTLSQVLIIDLKTGELLDANRDFPSDSRVGVPVGRLPLSITARQRTEVIAEALNNPDDVNDNSGKRIVRTEHFANVASSNGIAYFVVAAERWQVFDVDLSAPNLDGTLIDELSSPVLQLADNSPSSPSASNVSCELDDAVVQRILDLDEEAENLSCSAEQLPQFAPISDAEEIFTFSTRAQRVLELSEDGGTLSTIETTQAISNDFMIPGETWSFTYEGTISERNDLLIDETFAGMLRVQGGDLCSEGVLPGDLLKINSATTPASPEQDCSAYEDAELLYRVAQVQGLQLLIEVIAEDDASTLNRDDDDAPLAQTLPVRACFSAGLSAQIYPDAQWVLSGRRLGRLNNRVSQSGVCVPRFDWDSYQFRARSGETFSNPYFSVAVTEGEIIPPRGFSFTFSTRSGFVTRQLSSLGPSSSDIQQVDSGAGSFIPVIDPGTNIVRIYDANTLQLITFLL